MNDSTPEPLPRSPGDRPPTATATPEGIPEPAYQLLSDGQPTGPFPLSVVVEGLQSGRIQPTVLAWTEGWSEWRPLGELLPECAPSPVHPPRPAVPHPANPTASSPGVGLQLLGALTYPFNGDGLILLAAGTLFFAGLGLVQSLTGIFSMVLGLFSAGYLFAMLQNIVQSSSVGEDRMPSWPDFEGWGSHFLRPVLLWFASLAVCIGPGVVLLWLGAGQNNSTLTGLGIAFTIGGAVYFPMGVLAVAMTDSLGGLDPRLVVPSIARIPGRYAIAIAVMAGVLALHTGGSLVVDRFPLRPVARLWDGFSTLYLAVVQARLLGLLYFTSQDRFHWS
jgi:hypothetical protein